MGKVLTQEMKPILCLLAACMPACHPLPIERQASWILIETHERRSKSQARPAKRVCHHLPLESGIQKVDQPPCAFLHAPQLSRENKRSPPLILSEDNRCDPRASIASSYCSQYQLLATVHALNVDTKKNRRGVTVPKQLVATTACLEHARKTFLTCRTAAKQFPFFSRFLPFMASLKFY